MLTLTVLLSCPSRFAHGWAQLWRPTMQITHDYWLMQDKWLIINLICRLTADGALAGVIKLKAVWIVKNKENYRKEKDEQLR